MFACCLLLQQPEVQQLMKSTAFVAIGTLGAQTTGATSSDGLAFDSHYCTTVLGPQCAYQSLRCE